jgi:hypothetical protein
MRTRSQSKKVKFDEEFDYPTQKQKQKQNQIYEVNIDFDEASEAWKANKKSIGNGSYKYICLQKTKAGNQCKNQSLLGYDCCTIHKKLIK